MQQLRAIKLADPTGKLVVCGCLAEQDRDRMQKIAPHLDAVFGTSIEDLARLGSTLAGMAFEFRGWGRIRRRARAIGTFGRQHGGLCRRSFHAPARVRDGAAWVFVLLHVLHRAHVRRRMFERPPDGTRSSPRCASASREARARSCWWIRQTVNAWRDPENDALDFGDLCRAVAALGGLERLTFISPVTQRISPKRSCVDLAEIP